MKVWSQLLIGAIGCIFASAAVSYVSSPFAVAFGAVAIILIIAGICVAAARP